MKADEIRFSSKQGSVPSITASAAPDNVPKIINIYFRNFIFNIFSSYYKSVKETNLVSRQYKYSGLYHSGSPSHGPKKSLIKILSSCVSNKVWQIWSAPGNRPPPQLILS